MLSTHTNSPTTHPPTHINFTGFNLPQTPSRPCQNCDINLFSDYSLSQFECGRPKARARIINGANVLRNQYPWQVRLSLPGKDAPCGGSVLTRDKILTAAHCTVLYSAQKFTVWTRDSVLRSHWSRSNLALLWLVASWFHLNFQLYVTNQALWCHKDKAQPAERISNRETLSHKEVV